MGGGVFRSFFSCGEDSSLGFSGMGFAIGLAFHPNRKTKKDKSPKSNPIPGCNRVGSGGVSLWASAPYLPRFVTFWVSAGKTKPVLRSSDGRGPASPGAESL